MLRRLFRKRALPGWLLVFWALLIEFLDWWGRIELIREKFPKVPPVLLSVLEFLLSASGRLLIMILGFSLLIFSVFRGRRPPAADHEMPGVAQSLSWSHLSHKECPPTDRQFVDTTPDKLMNMCRNHMDIQAQRLVAPYIGKWMKTSGRIQNILSSSKDSAQLTFIRDTRGEIRDFYMYFADSKQIDSLTVLNRGDQIEVLGKITKITGIYVQLDECELVD